MYKDLLLEIGTEEIPAGYFPLALQYLKNNFKIFLETNRIGLKDIGISNDKEIGQIIITWSTPRRLILKVTQLTEKQSDLKNEILGPPKQVAYDDKGNFTAAAIGFAKKQNIKPQDLILKTTERGEYICAVLSQKGKKTEELLIKYLPELIKGIGFPKRMRWQQDNFSFARPIRWILCLWDNKILKFRVGDLTTSNKTRGHLILSNNKQLTIKNINQYEKILEKNFVMVSNKKRQEKIDKQAERVADTKGQLKYDQELLKLVTNLTEWPNVILGEFDKKYLNLPEEVLITCLKHHQKYFSLVDNKGKLLPYFIGVSNGDPRAAKVIREGFQRVLAARLEDAEFFYKIDTKKSFEEYVEKLKGVVFQEKLGTLFNKVERIIKLSEYICAQLDFTCYNLTDVERTALLCKADLVTEMVKEFPELQGIIGREYARVGQEKEDVCQGIYEHYLPVSLADSLPKTMTGAIVSIADKIDTIVSDFALGLVPDSSGDPYGLRRQAQAVIRILAESNKWKKFSLFELIEKEIQILKYHNIEIINSGDLLNKVWKFFRERIEYVFSSGYFNLAYDEVAAALDVGYSDIYNTLQRTRAINKLRKLEDFEPIAAGFKRANNILKQARDKKLLTEDQKLDERKLSDEAEKQLFQKFVQVKIEVDKIFQESSIDYEKALKELVSLREAIDTFFDKVMVMVEDRQLMANRLMLLKEIVGLFQRIADISKLVISTS